MPILEGRSFEAGDGEGAPLVGIISERVARRYWPAGHALGRQIRLGSDPDDPQVTIVGIAKSGRYQAVRDDRSLMLYLPMLQRHRSYAELIVSATVDPRSLLPVVRREVGALDPSVPVFDVRTMEEHLDRALSRDRLVTTLSGLFAVLALALSAVGVYGVMAYFSGQRTREIGIRLALGAQRRHVLGLIVGRGTLLIVLGLAAGLVGAFALTRVLTGLLYNVSGTDAVTFAGVVLLLASVGLGASYLPARRATRVDPMEVLRQE